MKRHRTNQWPIKLSASLVLLGWTCEILLPLHAATPPQPGVSKNGAPAELVTMDSGLDKAENLAEKAQNPVSDLISLPVQSNFNFNTGPLNQTVYLLNLQPVIPIKLNKDWNMITRTIIPIINAPSVAPGVPSAFGLGDINPTLFFSPSKPSAFTWGFGPTFTLPTGTDSLLTSEKWSAGPAAVALLVQGPWVMGALVNNQWSVAGGGKKDVNALLVQPFVNYNLPGGWYLTSGPIITSNWKAGSDDRWTVPMGGGFGRVFPIAGQPMNVSLQAYDNVVRPTGASDWTLRFSVSFLFPK